MRVPPSTGLLDGWWWCFCPKHIVASPPFHGNSTTTSLPLLAFIQLLLGAIVVVCWCSVSWVGKWIYLYTFRTRTPVEAFPSVAPCPAMPQQSPNQPPNHPTSMNNSSNNFLGCLECENNKAKVIGERTVEWKNMAIHLPSPCLFLYHPPTHSSTHTESGWHCCGAA